MAVVAHQIVDFFGKLKYRTFGESFWTVLKFHYYPLIKEQFAK